MTPPEATLRELLLALEIELRRLDWWATHPPAPAAFASTLPFSCDTLALEQWLQWVYLPRMRALLDAGAPWPTASRILPYAEEMWLANGARVLPLLSLLDQLDRLIATTTSSPITQDMP